MSDYHDWNRPRPDDEDDKEADEEKAKGGESESGWPTFDRPSYDRPGYGEPSTERPDPVPESPWQRSDYGGYGEHVATARPRSRGTRSSREPMVLGIPSTAAAIRSPGSSQGSRAAYGSRSTGSSPSPARS